MANAFQDIATRVDAAINELVSTIASFGEISNEEAVKVYNLYRKHKLVKNDFVGGRITVKHGTLLDREVIRNAAKEA